MSATESALGIPRVGVIQTLRGWKISQSPFSATHSHLLKNNGLSFIGPQPMVVSLLCWEGCGHVRGCLWLIGGYIWHSVGEIQGKWIHYNAQESPALRLVLLHGSMGSLLRTQAKWSGRSYLDLLVNVSTYVTVRKMYFPSPHSTTSIIEHWGLFHLPQSLFHFPVWCIWYLFLYQITTSLRG